MQQEKRTPNNTTIGTYILEEINSIKYLGAYINDNGDVIEQVQAQIFALNRDLFVYRYFCEQIKQQTAKNEIYNEEIRTINVY